MIERRQILQLGAAGVVTGLSGCMFLGSENGDDTMTDDNNDSNNGSDDGTEVEDSNMWDATPAFTSMFGESEFNDALNSYEDEALEVFYTDIDDVKEKYGLRGDGGNTAHPMLLFVSVAHTKHLLNMSEIAESGTLFDQVYWGQDVYDVAEPDNPVVTGNEVIRCDQTYVIHGDVDMDRVEGLADEYEYEHVNTLGEFELYQQPPKEGLDGKVFGVNEQTFIFPFGMPEWGASELEEADEGQSDLLPSLEYRVQVLQGEVDRIVDTDDDVAELFREATIGAFAGGVFGHHPLIGFVPDQIDQYDTRGAVRSIGNIGDNQKGVFGSYYVVDQDQYGIDMNMLYPPDDGLASEDEVFEIVAMDALERSVEFSDRLIRVSASWT